jgi:hypothetical protein
MIKRKKEDKMAQPEQRDKAEMTKSDHKPKQEFQRAINEVTEFGGTRAEQDALAARQGDKSVQDYQAKEIITLLSKWRDKEDGIGDDVLQQVAWFCITQIEIDRKAKEEADKEQERVAKEAQESADKATNKTGDTQPNEERRAEANKRASV